MVVPTCMVDNGIVSIRNLCKAYKSVLRKWFRLKKRPSKHHLNKRHTSQLEEKEEVDEIGMKSFRSYEGDVERRNKNKNMGGLFKNKSMNSCFAFISWNNVSRKNDHGWSHETTSSWSWSPAVSMSSRTTSFKSLKSKRKRKERERESNNYCVHTNPSTPRKSVDTNHNNNNHHSPLSKNLNNVSSFRRIMYSSSSGTLKPPPIERDLECTLEELCFGCKKNVTFTRYHHLPTRFSGEIFDEEEETKTITIEPGWTKGTKIKFEGKGNDKQGAYEEDVIYYICEKTHELFKREGDDLEVTLEIPLLKALTGTEISVPLLGGHHMDVTIEEIIHPGYEKIIQGQGMPISKQPQNRGNLRVTFLVEFPNWLSPDQRYEIVRVLQAA